MTQSPSPTPNSSRSRSVSLGAAALIMLLVASVYGSLFWGLHQINKDRAKEFLSEKALILEPLAYAEQNLNELALSIACAKTDSKGWRKIQISLEQLNALAQNNERLKDSLRILKLEPTTGISMRCSLPMAVASFSEKSYLNGLCRFRFQPTENELPFIHLLDFTPENTHQPSDDILGYLTRLDWGQAFFDEETRTWIKEHCKEFTLKNNCLELLYLP